MTERFFRGRRSAEMAGGSGIGLTIVAELVQAHGGALEIASEPDQGTSVTLTFPAVDSVETRTPGLPQVGRAAELRPGGRPGGARGAAWQSSWRLHLALTATAPQAAFLGSWTE